MVLTRHSVIGMASDTLKTFLMYYGNIGQVGASGWCQAMRVRMAVRNGGQYILVERPQCHE